MSLKAGRVGVNPADVDPVDGHIKSDVTSGYTKQEADAKFETQTHAASTYATKADVNELQPKTLAVPISMLTGSKLTVESALQGLNEGWIHNNISADLLISEVSTKVGDFNVYINKAKRIGIIVFGGNSVNMPVGTHEFDLTDALGGVELPNDFYFTGATRYGFQMTFRGHTLSLYISNATNAYLTGEMVFAF